MNLETTYSESELISLIIANNKVGFDYLYANYAAALLFCIKKIIVDDHSAEDILHDSFVNIWTKITSYNPDKSSFYTWMHTIAKNRAVDFTRGSVHKMKIRTLGNEDCIDKDAHSTEQKTNKIGLNKFVTKLPKDHKDLICLVYYSGHTIKEISVNLKMPEGTVKTRLRNAISTLRKEFE